MRTHTSATGVSFTASCVRGSGGAASGRNRAKVSQCECVSRLCVVRSKVVGERRKERESERKFERKRRLLACLQTWKMRAFSIAKYSVLNLEKSRLPKITWELSVALMQGKLGIFSGGPKYITTL